MMMQKLKPKEHTKLGNQSLVYEAFSESEKLTISEIANRVNEKLPKAQQVSEQTVRRAVKALEANGLLRPFGKINNSQTYGKLSATFTGEADSEVVPFAENLLSVEEFLRLLVDPEGRPLKLRTNLLAEKSQHALRRMMLFTVLSADSPGNNETLKRVNSNLNEAILELEYVAGILRRLVDSAIWYPQYRDRIALAVRKTQEKDPELFQMAQDYMRSE